MGLPCRQYLDGAEGILRFSPAMSVPGRCLQPRHRETSGMTFGQAITESLEARLPRVRRGAGKEWLSYSPGFAAASDWVWASAKRDAPKGCGGSAGCSAVHHHEDRRFVWSREAILMGWLASQTDMLGDDWGNHFRIF